MFSFIKEAYDLHVQRSIKCEECGRGFCFPSRLKQHHNRSLCKSNNKQKRNPASANSQFKCEKCQKTFSAKWNLENHKKFISCSKPGKCIILPELFAYFEIRKTAFTSSKVH